MHARQALDNGETPRAERALCVHGGLQFTALDCMAAWAVLIVRQPAGALPEGGLEAMPDSYRRHFGEL